MGTSKTAKKLKIRVIFVQTRFPNWIFLQMDESIIWFIKSMNDLFDNRFIWSTQFYFKLWPHRWAEFKKN